MCGIAGILTRGSDSRDDLLDRTSRMANSLVHRGPDDAGVWVDELGSIALGHRRLSILDLSVEGHQPMRSKDLRFTVVFNGEIYNFRDLRTELEALGHSFRGHSDTEILLAAVCQWGVRSALERFVGMFAFALWDVDKRVLTLARDRLGEKPLYYGWSQGCLLFGSELKALRAGSGGAWSINRDALALYFRKNYIPAPLSIYNGVLKLMPACFVQFSSGDMVPGTFPEPICYWDLEQIAVNGAATPFGGSGEEAVAELDRLLRASVARQMVADVPVGAFLSGGIDSSVVVATMQAQSSRPIRTFTIGFNESEYDEAPWAAAVAAHLKTEHTELYVTPDEAMAAIPNLPRTYDEPFSDSSQIPTSLVASLARRQVTVSLSGDGGDELFAGYGRYSLASKIWSYVRLMPRPLRVRFGKALRSIPVEAWNRASNGFVNAAGLARWKGRAGDRMHKLGDLLSLTSDDDLYCLLMSHWKDSAHLVQGADPAKVADYLRAIRTSARLPFLSRMCYSDSISYLPDDILVKVDRASMAVGLESRVPLLDHRLVEFAWTLPAEFKVRNGTSKWLLRQVLNRYVPAKLLERPKKGFGVPIDKWLRGPLKEWAEEYLSSARLKREGFIKAEAVRTKWEEHLSGRRRWHYYLWDVLMFETWLDSNKFTC